MGKGIIFNIQRFCVNDGEGIRTTVFFKGCPLKCAWCHNPESHQAKMELMLDTNKCVLCQKCATICPQNAHTFSENSHTISREQCKSCFACVSVCPTNALKIVGETKTAEEILETVMRDETFYKTSKGGLTISGGEPFFQFSFLKELLVKAKEKGLNTAIETCLYTEKENIEIIAPYVDTFLVDYKMTNEEMHKQYIGVSNKKILENLALLQTLNAKIILRCPIIPTLNDNKEHFNGIATLLNTYSCIQEAQIEPYHTLGNAKYSQLSRQAEIFQEPAQNTPETWLSQIKPLTNKPIKLA